MKGGAKYSLLKKIVGDEVDMKEMAENMVMSDNYSISLERKISLL